ncbi:uncharacterized protein METZ01_LOCUS61910, partial [marine metagenome]
RAPNRTGDPLHGRRRHRLLSPWPSLANFHNGQFAWPGL